MRSLTHAGLAVLTVLLLSTVSASATPVDLSPGSGWQIFKWESGLGPISGDGYDLSVSHTTDVDLTDYYTGGDEFEIFVFNPATNVTKTYFSTQIDQYATPQSWTDVIDTAWANHAEFSWLHLVLPAGNYHISLAVTQSALFPSGAVNPAGLAGIRADTTVHEPSTLLLGGGLALLGLLRRRLIGVK